MPFLNQPTERNSAVFISVENDTSNEVNRVTLKSNKGQLFSCSLNNNLCSIGILHTGDASFTVVAELARGRVLKSNIGYAEPGTDHKLLVSEFTE